MSHVRITTNKGDKGDCVSVVGDMSSIGKDEGRVGCTGTGYCWIYVWSNIEGIAVH